MLEMIGDRKFGFVRELRSGMSKSEKDPFCPPSLISRYRLRDGVVLDGFLRPGKKGDLQVSRLVKVMNIAPESWSRLHEFEEGRIIYPESKLDLVKNSMDITMRVVDLAWSDWKGAACLDCFASQNRENIDSKGNCSIPYTKSPGYSSRGSLS